MLSRLSAPPSIRLASTARGRMSAGSVKQVSHAIFDMDGLLLNTEEFYTEVQTQICKQFGREFTWELKVFVDELNLQNQLTAQQFLNLREARLDVLFPTAQLMPGAERLLRHLHAHGVPIALATSSHLRHFQLKTTLHTELFDLFQHHITGDQVINGKPAPDIFLKAAAHFSQPADPASCLVFEDAATGVQAGKAAGMHVIAVPDARMDRAAIAAADQVLDSLEQFRPEEWGLPPFEAA